MLLGTTLSEHLGPFQLRNVLFRFAFFSYFLLRNTALPARTLHFCHPTLLFSYIYITFVIFSYICVCICAYIYVYICRYIYIYFFFKGLFEFYWYFSSLSYVSKLYQVWHYKYVFGITNMSFIQE